MGARKRDSARKDVSCAVCGRPLELWDATTALDGRTVCASGCLGSFLAGVPEGNRDERPAETTGRPSWSQLPSVPVQMPEGKVQRPTGRRAQRSAGPLYDHGDYGGTVDGLGNVSSDADPGL
jgi:hypothetical protein